MPGTNSNEYATQAANAIRQWAQQTAEAAKPVAAQVKPLASDARQAAGRGVYRARVWVAPQVDRTGQALQDTVAPKVAAALHASALRLDPDKPKRNGWRMAAGISVLLAVAAAAVAVLRNRMKPSAITAAEEEVPAPVAEQANADGAKKPAHTS